MEVVTIVTQEVEAHEAVVCVVHTDVNVPVHPGVCLDLFRPHLSISDQGS